MPAAVKHFEARLEGYEPGLLTLTDDAGASFSLRQADAASVRLAVEW